jgi:hypothetical protein
MMFSRNMKVQEIENGYMAVFSKSELSELHKKYKGTLNVTIKKPISPGTEAQNDFFHALLLAFWLSDKHSAPEWVENFDKFKLWIKIMGGVIYKYEQAGVKYTIPESWANYNKVQRSELIEFVLDFIMRSGAYEESEKIREIIKGAEENNIFKTGVIK